MRILQQCLYFPPEIGGLESHVYFLCRDLARLGHEVTMITSHSVEGTPKEELLPDGVRVIRTWFPGKSPAGWLLHTAASIPAHLRAARSAQVVHAQTFASAPPGILARHRFGMPLVLTLHTSHFLRLARSTAWKPVLRRIISSCDWLLAASEEIRQVAVGLFPHPRSEALTNGVDTELFRPLPPTLGSPDGRRQIVVPRRLFEKNGVEYLIRALPAVRRHFPVRALIVGDGPERPRLEALARELGVEDEVVFLGAREHGQMPGLLCAAEVAVFPSLLEATSVAALEAMSCGVPVAASRVGGLPEIVDESVGTLFDPADPDDLAAGLVRLLRREDLRQTGERARARVVAHWGSMRLARRHLEIYEELLDEKSRRAA